MSKIWDCPRCGQETSGSYSEGGLLWAICDSCMSKQEKDSDEGEKNARDAYSGEREEEGK